MAKFDNLKLTGIPISKLLSICKKCRTKKDAKNVLRQYEIQCVSIGIAHTNLGYIFGYADDEERKRLYSLFPISHPMFGRGFGRGSDDKIVGVIGEFIEDNARKQE